MLKRHKSIRVTCTQCHGSLPVHYEEAHNCIYCSGGGEEHRSAFSPIFDCVMFLKEVLDSSGIRRTVSQDRFGQFAEPSMAQSPETRWRKYQG